MWTWANVSIITSRVVENLVIQVGSGIMYEGLGPHNSGELLTVSNTSILSNSARDGGGMFVSNG